MKEKEKDKHTFILTSPLRTKLSFASLPKEKLVLKLERMKKSLVLSLLIFLLSGCASRRAPSSVSSPLPAPAGKDCSYNVETDYLIKVDVFDNKPIYRDSNWYGDKEASTFVLIKRNAGIPAWKVMGGYGGGEMDEIGRTIPDADPDNPDGQGKRVFIGLGHCRGKPGETCLDPLPQNTLFVVQTEGAQPPDLPRDESAPGYWWTFKVYYDLSAFEGDGTPKNENLPSWIKNCVGGDRRRKEAVAATLTTSEEHPQFLAKSSIVPLSPLPSHWDEVKEFYKFDKTVSPYPPDVLEKLGTLVYKDQNFDVFYTLHPEGWLHLISPDAPQTSFQYEPVVQVVPQGKTLQLGTFNPMKKFVYEWWTPSCKPVIYLYPEKPLILSIFLRPFGFITKSEPHYSWFSGWRNFWAFPSGKLIYRGEEYDYLYYEGRIINVKVPKRGWIVKRNELSGFFDRTLPKLGLRGREIDDFKEYWLKRLKKDLYFVTFLPREEIERVEKMHISVKPNTLIRVRLYFKALDEPIEVSPPTFPNVPERKGFTVVDWGGFVRE